MHIKIKTFVITAILALASALPFTFVSTTTALTCAANDATCATSNCGATNNATGCIDCSKANTCSDTAARSRTCQNDPGHTNCDIINDYVNPAIKLLNVMVGLFAVISLAYAGVTYSMAGGDPQKVAKAKSRIRWTIVALVGYAFMYGFIQFLIPGGAFRNV